VKGVHVLLDAFALLLRDNPARSLRLSIAGSGETSAALLQKAATLGIGEQIEWLGLVEDTSPFFQAVDIYVQPSFAEGLPNSVMEAMVEQRPVIASDIGGNSDLIEDEVTGLLFTAGDATMLACCLQRLIDEPQLRHSLAQAGRQLIIDRYGFDHVVEQLVELYRG
jgi:glycosyltransferase involved in cell wall biosynthesis